MAHRPGASALVAEINSVQSKWMHLHINKADVSATLAAGPTGGFLVRASSKPGHFVLETKQADGNINTALISPDQKGRAGFRIRGAGPLFPNLSWLVYGAAYDEKVVQICKLPCRIVVPHNGPIKRRVSAEAGGVAAFDRMGAGPLRRLLHMHGIDYRSCKNLAELRGLCKAAFPDGNDDVLELGGGSGGAGAQPPTPTPPPAAAAAASDPEEEALFQAWNNLVTSWDDRLVDKQPTDLPGGWLAATDEDGDAMYVDTNQSPPLQTYDDPRTTLEAEPRPIVFQMAAAPKHHHHGGGGSGDAAVAAAVPAAKKRSSFVGAWVVDHLDGGAFKRMKNKIPRPAELAVYCRGHPYPNRYSDILPTDATRVQLSPINRQRPSTYINANWVKGDPAWDTTYIAAQGPTSRTVQTFVRMLWETNVECIVMTTGLVEKGRDKCARYWPSMQMKTMRFQEGNYGALVMNCVSEERTSHSLKTILTLTHEGSGKPSRKIIHHWYDTWPDHGVPQARDGSSLCMPMLELAAEVREFMDKRKTPILVHCSAGIGRTGTFMATDICTKILADTGKVDVVKVVDRLRSDRGGLVQHAAQLKFLHDAVRTFAENYGHDEIDEIVVDRTIGAIQIAGCSIRFSDLDGDGSMTLEDFQTQGASEALFHSVDRDNSKTVTKSEFRSYIANAGTMGKVRTITAGPGGGGGGGRGIAAHHAAWLTSLQEHGESSGTLYLQGMAFRFIDLDGDAQMSLFEAQTQGMPEDIFKLIDTSGDGNIDTKEFRKFVIDFAAKSRMEAKAKALTKSSTQTRLATSMLEGELAQGTVNYLGESFVFLDVDGDGSMSLSEAQLQGMPAEVFHAIDDDKSGDITMEEFRTFRLKQARGEVSLGKDEKDAWVVTDDELAASIVMMKKIDLNGDGVIAGVEAFGFFSESGLSRETLSQIWRLCDMNKSGKLTDELFALAEHIIRSVQAGAPIPETLSAVHVPPSMRFW